MHGTLAALWSRPARRSISDELRVWNGVGFLTHAWLLGIEYLMSRAVSSGPVIRVAFATKATFTYKNCKDFDCTYSL